MPERISLRKLADVQAVVCDAIHELLLGEDAEGGLRRLDEAAATLGGSDRSAPERATDPDGLAAALRAVKHLGRAMEDFAADAAGRGEMEIDSAVEALQTARRFLGSAYGSDGPSSSGPVQMSVAEALRVPNEQAIADALRDLLERSGPQAFVIFLDARSGNFVQFIGSKKEPLVLDLPFTSLSDEEMQRASYYFKGLGFEDAEGEESFSVTLDQDVQQATQLAAGVFHSVYQSEPDFSLKIEEN